MGLLAHGEELRTACIAEAGHGRARSCGVCACIAGRHRHAGRLRPGRRMAPRPDMPGAARGGCRTGCPGRPSRHRACLAGRSGTPAGALCRAWTASVMSSCAYRGPRRAGGPTAKGLLLPLPSPRGEGKGACGGLSTPPPAREVGRRLRPPRRARGRPVRVAGRSTAASWGASVAPWVDSWAAAVAGGRCPPERWHLLRADAAPSGPRGPRRSPDHDRGRRRGAALCRPSRQLGPRSATLTAASRPCV